MRMNATNQLEELVEEEQQHQQQEEEGAVENGQA